MTKPKHQTAERAKRATFSGIDHGLALTLDRKMFTELKSEGDGTVTTEHQIFPDARMFHPSDAETPVVFDGVFRANAIKSFQGSGLEVPIDFNHLSGGSFFAYPSKDDGAAAGWVTSLQDRGTDGLWGSFTWTEKGLSAIRANEYRYLSPEFSFKQFDKASGAYVAQPRLYAVALTNRPFLENQERIAATDPVVEEEVTMADTKQLADVARELEEMKLQLADRDAKLAKSQAAAEANAAAVQAVLLSQKTEAIEAGVAQGRIVPTMRASLEKFAAVHDLAEVKAFVAALPVQTRSKAIGQDPATTDGDVTTGLSEDDIAAAKFIGVDPKDMVKFGTWDSINFKGEMLKEGVN